MSGLDNVSAEGCTASASICLLAKRRWRPMRRGPDWCGIKGRLEPWRTGIDSWGGRLGGGGSSSKPARKQNRSGCRQPTVGCAIGRQLAAFQAMIVTT